MLLYSGFANGWHHIKMVWSGNDVTINVDGGANKNVNFANSESSGIARFVYYQYGSLDSWFDAFGYS
ncbi:hypothetical protein LCGC14_2281660, partial [marine sediment metagenome]